jgi:hypothetical protein
MVSNPYESPKHNSTRVSPSENMNPFLAGLCAACISYVGTAVGFVVSLSAVLGCSPLVLSRVKLRDAMYYSIGCGTATAVVVFFILVTVNGKNRTGTAFVLPTLIAIITSLCYGLWVSVRMG